MAINNSFQLREEMLPAVIIRFYTVGYVLFALPWTRNLFISITALSLLLVIALVFYFHKDWRIKSCIWFLFIILSSWFLEMAGVASGKIFGHYHYEEGLGWQIHGTPLIIGLNWLFLVYASRSIVVRYIQNRFMRIAGGAALMIGYDLLMEWVAPVMHMWRFDGGYPPVMNFVTWFMASLFYHAGFEFLRIRTANPVAGWLLIIQWFFFLLIAIYHLIFLI